MMNVTTKNAVRSRLRKIQGQVLAIERMVESDRYCIDIMHQLSAIQAALGKVSEVVFSSHVRTCVSDAVKSGDERERERKLDELVAVFGGYRGTRAR